MPRGNGTGPEGFGPTTGRGAGFCAGNSRPGFMTPGGRGGMGFARGGFRFGRGRGFSGRGGAGFGYGGRNMFQENGGSNWTQYQPDPETEKEALKNQADALHSELDFLKSRLSDIVGAESEE